MFVSLRAFFVLAIALPTLLGCTAASMRVDVDVYKGPLSKEPQVQLGELTGLMRSLADQFHNLGKVAHELHDEKCSSTRISDDMRIACATLKSIETGCGYTKDLRATVDLLMLARCKSNICVGAEGHDSFVELLSDVSSISAALKSRALNDAYLQNSWRPQDQRVRILSTNYMNLASEASNQLGSRADALLKQLNGVSAEKLSQSVYLRDSAPTSLLNAYVWDRAMARPLDGEFEPYDLQDRQDRVRALEQHFADYYWSNINTVVASGEGEVGMALVKDDIGNWNLKNFETDPTEQIQAYKDVGLASLSTAAKLAADSTKGPLTNAQAFLAIANQFNFGTAPTAGPSLDGLLTNLRSTTVANLRGLADQAKTRRDELRQSINAASTGKPALPAPADSDCAPQEESLPIRKAAYDLLVELSPATSDSAKKAKDAAQCALDYLDNKTESACVPSPGPAPLNCQAIANAKAWINEGEQLRKLYQDETELAALPGQTARKVREVLDGYERTLAELGRIGTPALGGITAAPQPGVSIPGTN